MTWKERDIKNGKARTAAVRGGAIQSEGRYRDIRQITNHPGEQPDPETAAAAHTVTGPSPTSSHCTGLLRTAYAKQYRDIKLYDNYQMGSTFHPSHPRSKLVRNSHAYQ